MSVLVHGSLVGSRTPWSGAELAPSYITPAKGGFSHLIFYKDPHSLSAKGPVKKHTVPANISIAFCILYFAGG